VVDRNTFNKNIALAPCFATALALSATSVIAPTELHAQETLELYPVSIGVPSGFGASSGMLFGWVDYTNFDPYTGVEGDDDGSMGLGFGLGDPAETIGLEVSVSITSVSTGWWGDGVFGDEGSLNLKVHRYVPGLAFASYASLSFGLDNIVGWGDETEGTSDQRVRLRRDGGRIAIVGGPPGFLAGFRPLRPAVGAVWWWSGRLVLMSSASVAPGIGCRARIV
jgi:hypothetical protein